MNDTKTGETSADEGPEIRKRAFERKARQATHQILFYLGLYFRPVTFWKRKTHKRTNDVLEKDSGETLVRLKALVDGVGFRGDPAETDSWVSLRKKIEACGELWPYKEKNGDPLDEKGTDEKLMELRNNCTQFLKDSSPRGLVTPITHILNRGKVRLFRWLAEIIIGAAALFLLFGLPQVAGLVWQSLFFTVLIGFFFFIPTVFVNLAGRRENRYGRQYWWDFGGQPFRHGIARSPERGFCRFAEESGVPFALIIRIVLNIITYLVFLVAVLLIAYLLSCWQGEIIFTVALILALLFVIYGVAQLLDFWDYFDSIPVRLLFLWLLVGAFFGINSFKLWIAPLILWALFAAELAVFIVWKIGQMKKQGGGPARRTSGQAVAITAGLFLMAWLVTNITVTQFGKPWRDADALTAARIPAEEWPLSQGNTPGVQEEPVVVLTASGGGSRAAIYAAHTLMMLHEDKFSRIGGNLQAISSVSGGSLANAVYVAMRRGTPWGPALLADLEGQNGLMEKVGRDFLQPTIFGALRGTALGWLGGGWGRSESIENAWREIGLDIHLDVLVREWREAVNSGASTPPFPIPLFNSTSLGAHRVVITPLAVAAYTDPGVMESAREENLYDRLPERYPDFSDAAEEPTAVYYRDGIYGLENLLPKYIPNLAQCVRASANFPVGFPLVRVETSQPLFYSPSADRRRSGGKKARDNVYLSDGGVLSNSGVWSLYYLLQNRYPKLKDRGVLVIVVDASAMPDYQEQSRINGLFGAIRTQHPIGQALHRRMFESLKNRYGQRIQIVQIDLIPTEATNIETTWTLSEKSKESLKKQFETRRPEFEEDLEAAWNALVSREGDGPERYLERPPVD